MKVETLIKKLKKESKDNDWVVITDDDRIWGSQASLSAIKMCGGIVMILNAFDIKVYPLYKNLIHDVLNHEHVTFKGILETINNIKGGIK